MWSYYSQADDSYCIRFSRKKLINYLGDLFDWDENYFYGSLFYKEDEIKKFIFDVFDDQIYTDIFEASEKDISNVTKSAKKKKDNRKIPCDTFAPCPYFCQQSHDAHSLLLP